MKILVFGGTQFVSWYFVKRFAEDGHEVITLTRGTKRGIHGGKIKELYADRHNLEDLKNALKEIDADYVIDVSGYTASDVKVSCEALKTKKLKGYIFISSSAVYKESEILPIKEDFPVGENRFWGKYGTDKLEAEIFLMAKHREENFPVVILRPPYIYGEGNNVYREAFIFDRLKENKPVILPGNGKTLIHFIHIEDLYKTAAELIAQNIKSGIYNVGNYEGITFRGWVQKCMEAFGRKTEIIEFDYLRHNYKPRDFFPFNEYQYYLDIRNVSGIYSPKITLEEGLHRALAWYNENEDKVAKRSHYSENCGRIADNELK